MASKILNDEPVIDSDTDEDQKVNSVAASAAKSGIKIAEGFLKKPVKRRLASPELVADDNDDSKLPVVHSPGHPLLGAPKRKRYVVQEVPAPVEEPDKGGNLSYKITIGLTSTNKSVAEKIVVEAIKEAAGVVTGTLSKHFKQFSWKVEEEHL